MPGPAARSGAQTALTPMPDFTAFYRSARVSVHQAGRSRALLLSKDQGQVMEMDARAARLLGLCQGCKTLEGHASAIAKTGAAGDFHSVLATVQSLALSGLLRSCADLLPSTDMAAAEVRPVSTMAIVTAGRPRVLRRGLASFARHLDEHGQHARLLVVDGSRDTDHQTENQRVITDLAPTTNRSVEYVGVAEAQTLRQRLVSAGVFGGTIDFGLTPGSTGANRNLVLLMTAGTHVLMADDDIVCEPWMRPEASRDVALWGHAEVQDTEFYPTRADARHVASSVPVDLLAAHAAILGQPLAALLTAAAGHADLGEACAHVLGALVERRSASVRATFTGIAGDAGTYCPYARLFSSGPTQARLASSRDVYELALRSREVLKVASRTTLTHDPRCMAGCIGLDNHDLLPPFMPIGRNEDGVFGATLHALDPLTLFAHLPVGVVHDSDRPATYDDRSMRSASETRVSELLMLAIRAAMLGVTDTDPAARLVRLASALGDLGRLDTPDFVTHATRLVLDSRAQQLVRIEAMVSRSTEYPPYWRAGLEEYRRAVVRSLTRPDFFLPIEFQDAGSVAAGFERLRRFVGQFGALLDAWPAMREASRNWGSGDLAIED